MTSATFEAVDTYIEKLFIGDDPALTAALAAAAAAGMPDIQVSAVQGKFLYLLAKMIGAKRILELGTLAGYSTIWLARALPDDGQLVTCEYDQKHAKVARGNLDRAGLGEKVEIITGAALETLPKLVARNGQPFDLVFLDADKNNYSNYLDWALKLTRSGSFIIADNVVRGGAVLAPKKGDAFTNGARDFNAKLAADPRLEAIVLQSIGAKGHDGLAYARVK